MAKRNSITNCINENPLVSSLLESNDLEKPEKLSSSQYETCLTYRDPDGNHELLYGKGVDNECFLKFLSCIFTGGIIACCQTIYLNPDEYIIMKNITGEVGVLGPGDTGSVYSWKLLLSRNKVHNIKSNDSVQSGPLKIVPVNAGTYSVAYDVNTRNTIFLKAGLHIITPFSLNIGTLLFNETNVIALISSLVET